MTEEVRAILTDKEVIAIDQDPLGKQGGRLIAEPSKSIEIWAKELSNGEWAVCALNTSTSEAELTIDFSHFGWVFKGNKYSLRDVWAKKAVGTSEKPYTAKVASHDVILLRATPLK